MSPNLQKISVADLRIGMYVAQLDRDWLETPFILQGFEIESRDDIEIVAEYCEFVFVDPVYKARASQRSSDVAEAFKAKGAVAYQNTALVDEEHKRIVGAFRQARSLTKNLLDDIRLGGAINTSHAKQMVNDCVQSVIRHPDALLWMAKIRSESEYTAEHCLNVCILAVAFGRSLGMSEDELHKLGMCGLLHDVGKMKVPPEILNKPSALNIKEMRAMMAHTIHGRNLLLSTDGIYNGVIDVAYSHHERVDGKGYPRKLAGQGISLYSKIIAIVDAYDAMTADRCYQTAKTSTEALKIIYQERGSHFDERLALKFLQTVGLYPPGSIVELHSGQVGIVVETNHKLRHLPKVLLVRDAQKQPLEKDIFIDLAQIEEGDLSKDYLIKQVWKDQSFGISLRRYQEQGLVLNR
jgi:HD-GYP domain-containing protein (c-di-GMP phosphodiesterase class II)